MLCCVCACVYAYALWCVVSNEETDGAHSRVWWCRHANTGDSGKDGGTAWVCLFIAYMCLCTSMRNMLTLFIRTYRLYICVYLCVKTLVCMSRHEQRWKLLVFAQAWSCTDCSLNRHMFSKYTWMCSTTHAYILQCTCSYVSLSTSMSKSVTTALA